VADKLNIPIHRVEFIEKYWKKVFQYLIREYKAGRTPNPDVLCNKYIKFDEFISYAKKQFNCDQIAMGHYANIKKIGSKYYLCKSITEDKDQTYFLCGLNQKQLNHTLFPIGNIDKNKVRSIAKVNGLDNWSKKDSTGICFIGERKFKLFLNNYIPYKKGKVIDIVTKKVVGTHDGVTFFTYGQNKGLSLSGQKTKYFVCKKDVKHNILFVCDNIHKAKYLLSSQCELINFNWISGVPKTRAIQIRFRHRQNLIKGSFVIKGNKVYVKYTSTLSVTPGQFAVFYQKDVCLGGGIVNRIM
jgi:tRNA-specific 2-thiouridylase